MCQDGFLYPEHTTKHTTKGEVSIIVYKDALGIHKQSHVTEFGNMCLVRTWNKLEKSPFKMFQLILPTFARVRPLLFSRTGLSYLLNIIQCTS